MASQAARQQAKKARQRSNQQGGSSSSGGALQVTALMTTIQSVEGRRSADSAAMMTAQKTADNQIATQSTSLNEANAAIAALERHRIQQDLVIAQFRLDIFALVADVETLQRGQVALVRVQHGIAGKGKGKGKGKGGYTVTTDRVMQYAQQRPPGSSF